MQRYFDQVMETAGLYNTAGFKDDTRAFCSIPVRHDVWRRVSANWVAGLVARHIIDMDDAREMMVELAVGLARRAYRFKLSLRRRHSSMKLHLKRQQQAFGITPGNDQILNPHIRN